LIVALMLGPLIGGLSQAVMAGLLIALGIELVDKWTLARIRRALLRGSGPSAARADLAVVAVVVVTTVLIDLTTAVGVGVVMSLFSFVMQMARSPIRRIYRGNWLISRVFGDFARRQFLEQYGQRIAIIELEGALFFGTTSELGQSVDTLIAEGVVHVVLDMRRVKHIDATGARALEQLNSRLMARKGLLVICHVERERRRGEDRPVDVDNRRQSTARTNWIKLADLGTINAIGEERFLGDADAAIAQCERHLAISVTSTEETTELLALESPLMRSLDRSMRRRLLGYLSRISYAAGEIVFIQDSQPDGAYFVVGGRLEVLINVPGTERKRKMQTLTAGSVFGEMALLDARPRSASIVTVEPTTCYWMSSAKFARLKQEQSDIALALLSDVAMIFSERLRATTSLLAEMDA
jgi:SulP family sulfate permease